jgi:two-component system, response regulator, stage 0 sporulation protein F
MDRSTQLPVILIVDDEPGMLVLLNHRLRYLAPTYDIITVRDAQSALSHLAQRTVPLLITDYMMPGMNGLQLTVAVKATSPTTYVILATAYAAEIDQRAREQQVDTVLSKTGIFDHLEDVVHRVLRLASPKE